MRTEKSTRAGSTVPASQNKEMKGALKKHAALSRRSAREGFIHSVGKGSFLLVEVPEEWDDDIGFNTSVRTIPDVDAILSTPDDSMEPGFFLAKIEKSSRADWVRWVTLGRARNNDIVLRHSSISKLHAQIHVDPNAPGACRDAPAYFIIDANSANGTQVNGKPQHRGEPTPLSPGDEVVLGDLMCTFLDAGGLYERLRSFPRNITF